MRDQAAARERRRLDIGSAEPLHLRAAGAQAGAARAREMTDLLTVEEPKPKPANSYDTAIRAVS